MPGPYVPRVGTGNYVVLKILYEARNEPSLSLDDLKTRAERSGESNTSFFFRAEPGANFHTAWSGVKKKLVDKERYVTRTMRARHNFARDIARLAYFKITDRGAEVYRTYILGEVGGGAGGDNLFHDDTDSSNSDDDDGIPLTNQVYLYVDDRETPRGQADNKDRREEFIKQLDLAGIPYKIKHLEVGDFVWVVRTPKGEDFVLDYIVERKRMDDLEGSLIDGRYRDQKGRMRVCGLKNLIYLVESFGSELRFKKDDADRRKQSIGDLRGKISETQIRDGFYVVKTRSPEETAIYLEQMTLHLQMKFEEATLIPPSNDTKGNLLHMEDDVELMLYEKWKGSLLGGSVSPSKPGSSHNLGSPTKGSHSQNDDKKEFNQVIPVIHRLVNVLVIKTWDELKEWMKNEEEMCKQVAACDDEAFQKVRQLAQY